jgi:hypothetical protein
MEKLVAFLKSPFTIPSWAVDFLIFASIAQGLLTLLSAFVSVPLLVGGIASLVVGVVGTVWATWVAK